MARVTTRVRSSGCRGRAKMGGSRSSRNWTVSRQPTARSARRVAGRAGGSARRGNYAAVRKQLSAKVSSYRLLLGQLQGRSGAGAPGTTTVNRLANLVARGANVYTVSHATVARLAGGKKNAVRSVSKVLRALRSRYGTAIKAVAAGKGSNWLIAAMTRVGGKPFRPGW